jgi:hypothetical protein
LCLGLANVRLHGPPAQGIGMQKYKIKRAGREFVVYAGDDQVLRCASRSEAESAVASATGKSPYWFQKRRTDLPWLVAAIVFNDLSGRVYPAW